MGLATFVETFAVSTGAAGTTQQRTGLGSPVKVAIAYTSGHVGATEGINRRDYKRSFGAATSTSNLFCAGDQNDDGGITMSTDKIHRNDAILGTITNAGALDGLLNISAFDTSSVTYQVGDQFAVGVGLTTFYLTGTDVTNAEVFQFAQPTSAGAQVTTLPFADPNCLIFFSSCGAQDINTIQGGGSIMLGACVKSPDGTLTQAVSTARAADAVADADVSRYTRSGQCCAAIASSMTGLDARGSVTSISGTSMTINWASADTTARIIFGLAIKGPAVSLKTFTTKTDTTTPIIVDAGLTLRGGMLVTSGTSEHADDTPTASDQFSVGFFSSTTNRNSQSIAYIDATTSAQSSAQLSTDEALAVVSLDASPVADWEIDVSSISGSTVNFIHDDAAGSATNFVWGLFFGDAGSDAIAAQQPFWRWHY